MAGPSDLLRFDSFGSILRVWAGVLVTAVAIVGRGRSPARGSAVGRCCEIARC